MPRKRLRSRHRVHVRRGRACDQRGRGPAGGPGAAGHQGRRLSRRAGGRRQLALAAQQRRTVPAARAAPDDVRAGAGRDGADSPCSRARRCGRAADEPLEDGADLVVVDPGATSSSDVGSTAAAPGVLLPVGALGLGEATLDRLGGRATGCSPCRSRPSRAGALPQRPGRGPAAVLARGRTTRSASPRRSRSAAAAARLHRAGAHPAAGGSSTPSPTELRRFWTPSPVVRRAFDAILVGGAGHRRAARRAGGDDLRGAGDRHATA